MGDWSQRYDQISSDLAKSAEEKADAVYSSLLTQPKTVVILALIVAAWFAQLLSYDRKINDCHLPHFGESGHRIRLMRVLPTKNALVA